MRSKWPILWLCLAALCGAMLFNTSQRVTDGRTHLDILAADTQKEQESIRVLQAEWGYLNQPARLEKLARAHLSLEPMKGKQFATAEALNGLAPAAGDEAPAATPQPEDAAAPAVIAQEPQKKEDIVQKEPVRKPIVKKEIAKKAPPPKKSSPVAIRPYNPPYHPPAAQPAPRAAQRPDQRGFGDLMKSLGVH